MSTTFAVAMPAQRSNVTSGSKRRYGRLAAWSVSALLHLLLIWLALVWIVPHESRASVGRQIGPVISLGEMLKPDQSGAAAAPATKPAARPHAAKPTHRVASHPPAAAPNPLPQPQPPTEVAQAALPQTQADPGPQAAAADPAPAASTQGASSAPMVARGLPIEYLTQISNLITAFRNTGRGCAVHRHDPCYQAVVHMKLGQDGSVLNAGLVESSGYRQLDEKALGYILHIGKFPPPPSEWVSNGVFVVDQPIKFSSTT